jgi:cold shock CspA family protein
VAEDISAPSRARLVRTGTVEEFDEPRGLGVVGGDDGRRYGFHCTAVADGSRRIDVGTRVVFIAVAGHRGRVEARDIVSLPPGAAAAGS